MNPHHGQCHSTLILVAPEVFANIYVIGIWNFGECLLESALLKKASELNFFSMIIIVYNII